MALFRNFGVNHTEGVPKDVTVLRNRLGGFTIVRLRAIPLISLNLQKIAHFWIGSILLMYNSSVFAPFSVPVIYGERRERRCKKIIGRKNIYVWRFQRKWAYAPGVYLHLHHRTVGESQRRTKPYKKTRRTVR